MPMGDGVEEEEMLMPQVEQEAAGMELVLQAKQQNQILLDYIAMTIFSDAAMSTMIGPMKRSLES